MDEWINICLLLFCLIKCRIKFIAEYSSPAILNLARRMNPLNRRTHLHTFNHYIQHAINSTFESVAELYYLGRPKLQLYSAHENFDV